MLLHVVGTRARQVAMAVKRQRRADRAGVSGKDFSAEDKRRSMVERLEHAYPSKLHGLRCSEGNAIEPLPLLPQRRPEPIARLVPFVAHQSSHHLFGSLDGGQAILERMTQ